MEIKVSRIPLARRHAKCGCGEPFVFQATLSDGRTFSYWCERCDRSVK